MDQTKLDLLLKLLAETINAVNENKDVSFYYVNIVKWMEENADGYLKK